MRRIWLFLLLILVHPDVLMAQTSQFGNQLVYAGATCPPTFTPGGTAGGAGSVYTCTGTGAFYTYTGSAWMLVAAGAATIAGTIADTQVAFGSAADTIAGSANLTYATSKLINGTQASVPAAFQNWWDAGLNTIYNNSNDVIGMTVISRGADSVSLTGAALNVLSFGEGADDQPLGIWAYAHRTSALAFDTVYGLVTIGRTAAAGTAAVYGNESTISVAAGITATTGYNYRTQTILNGVFTTAYGYDDRAFSIGAGGSMTTYYAFHADELDPSKVTNPYYLWFDSDGVYRVKEDNTFDMVGQAIATLYNPQFTKYTAGAENFERCIPGCQWNGNVAEIGNEAGGTGTLRALRLIGTGITMIPFTASGSGLAVADVGADSCGTTDPSIAGGPNSFEVTVGATAGTQCRVTFPTAAANRWNCSATNNATGNLVRAVYVDTTHVDLIGIFAAADVINTICVPR